MIHVYFISGLGADGSVFARLKLFDQFKIHHLPWLKPNGNEPIESYARRMAEDIENPEASILVGLSFGGVIAIEIAKFLSIKKIILISSVKTDDELPPWLKFIGRMELDQVLPAEKLLGMRDLGARFFGCTTPDQREMLERLFDRAEPEIVGWSIRTLLIWNNEVIPENLYHIHGTADTVFPKAFASPNEWVEGGSHFMVYSHAEELSAILNRQLLPSD